MARLRLFGSPISPFVTKVMRALALKGLAYEPVEPRAPGDLRRWSPQTGKMPVLEVDGERCYDSTFILRRLEALQPDPPLYAREPRVAARQRQLEDWSDESLYWYLMALRWCDRNAAATADQIASSLPVPALARPLLRPLFRRQIGSAAVAQGLGRLPHDVLVAELGGHLDDLALVLGDDPFFHAERPSAADLSLFGMLAMGTSGPTPEVGRQLAPRSSLVAWRSRVDQATGG